MFRYFAFNFLDIIIGVLDYGSTGSAIELRSLLVIIHNVNLLPAGKKMSSAPSQAGLPSLTHNTGHS
jgi:hypothetical protein